MLFRKFQTLSQWVGMAVLIGLALYGMVSLGGGRLWAAVETAPAPAPNTEADAPLITIPSTFNYQGFLRDPQGKPMNGSQRLDAKLYNVASGGAALYSATFLDVNVRDGFFNIVLGDSPALDPNIFVNNVPLFVGITVNEGSELIPRQRIHPVPWALLATNAQSATTLAPNASVQNLTHIGPLSFNDSDHKIDTTSDQFTNGDVLRFFGPEGFSWVHADDNQYIMHLNKTVGLWVGGKVTASGDIGAGGNIAANGDIRSAGAEVVVGRDNDMMIVRGWGTANTTVGQVNGAEFGSGYTYKKISQGVVDVTFSSPFAGVPTVTATALSGGSVFTHITGLGGSGFHPTASGFRIIMYDTGGNGRDWPFNFIAIGARPGSARNGDDKVDPQLQMDGAGDSQDAGQ